MKTIFRLWPILLIALVSTFLQWQGMNWFLAFIIPLGAFIGFCLVLRLLEISEQFDKLNNKGDE